MIPRRAFVITLAGAGVALVAPRLALAQPEKARIGVLVWQSEDKATPEQFRESFRDAGWVDGRNAEIQFRWAAGSTERAAQYAAELVRANVDVLVVRATPAVQPAVLATRTIPIVTFSADPIGVGLVATLNKPGGNVTGVSTNSVALSAKRLELIRALLPRASRVAYLASSVDPQGARFVEATTQEAPKLGFQIQPVFIKGVNDLKGAFAAIVKRKPDALIVQPLFGNDEIVMPRILEFMYAQRLPMMSDQGVFAENGGLVAFGADTRALMRELGLLVDKVLRGAKPGDLPVQEPSTFALVINTKTAKAIGLTIPPSVLLRATRVIE